MNEEEKWESASVTFHFTKEGDGDNIYNFAMGHLARNAKNEDIHRYGLALAKLAQEYHYFGATKTVNNAIELLEHEGGEE